MEETRNSNANLTEKPEWSRPRYGCDDSLCYTAVVLLENGADDG
jgi:hypothetical protein